MADRLPNPASKVAFFDKWINRRMDEAAAMTAQLDERMAFLARAQNGTHKLIETLKTDVASVSPALARLEAARQAADSATSAAAIAKQAQQAAREQIQLAVEDSRQALQEALAPVELDCASRLEAMLLEAQRQMDATARQAISQARGELQKLQEDWLSGAQAIRDSLGAILSGAEESAGQLAETIEKTMQSAQAAVTALSELAAEPRDRAPAPPAPNEQPRQEEPSDDPLARRFAGDAAPPASKSPSEPIPFPDSVVAAADRALKALTDLSATLDPAD